MISLYRFSRWLYLRRVPFVPWVLYCLNRYLFSLVLPPQAVVGKRVLLGYRGLGIVFHPETIVGNDVIVGPHVVFGGRTGREGAPKVGDGCVIGSGAAVLGAVVLGENVKIGSNSVVLNDVPSNATAVGVPARVIDNSGSAS